MKPMEANKCAWCQAERGEQPQPGQSHGICQRHRDELLRQVGELTGRVISGETSTELDGTAATLLPNDHLADIMATGRRYDRAFYALAIVAGCVAAGALIVVVVWTLQATGHWPQP